MSARDADEIDTAAPRRGRPRDARADEAIIAATLSLVARAGVAGLSVDAVAAAAGCSKATIYRRWASKEALVLDALRAGAAPIPAPDTGSLRSDLEAYAVSLLERSSQGRIDVLPHLVQAGAADVKLRDSLHDYIGQREGSLRTIVRRGMARGELPAGVDVDVLIDVLLGPLLYRKLFTVRVADAQFVRRLIDAVVSSATSTALVVG